MRAYGGDQSAADADHHRVTGAESLLAAIVDRTHRAGDGRVLHGDAADAGESARTGVLALHLPVDQKIVLRLDDGLPPTVPAGRPRLHLNRIEAGVRPIATRSTTRNRHLVRHGVMVVQRHFAGIAFAESEHTWRRHRKRREQPLGYTPVDHAIGGGTACGIRGATLGRSEEHTSELQPHSFISYA